ncbi:MAG TPA: glycine cleavage system protein GcvH [Bacteroidales bacterium]|nr:glycine cleavage system protein GcvH [Bacteroidales bacterium]
MKVPDNLKFTEDHEWLRVENGYGYVGVTDFAQSELGDVVFLEVETVGESLSKGEVIGTIEAVKTVSDILMPVSGEILEFNGILSDQPEMVNKDPYGEGWVVKVKIADPAEVDELLNAEEYRKLTEV